MTCSLSNLFREDVTHTLLCLTESSPWLPGNGDGYGNPPVALVLLGALGLSSFQCMHLEQELLLQTACGQLKQTLEIPPFSQDVQSPVFFITIRHQTTEQELL